MYYPLFLASYDIDKQDLAKVLTHQGKNKEQKNTTIKIMNVLGQEIRECSIYESTTLDLKVLADGVYYIYFYINNRLIKVEKIIKKI